jgi:hypothetical protein
MINELEEEWEKKRTKYAATNVDTEAETAAVSEIVRFADITGHGKACCFVGHWFYHGEGGLPKSAHDALLWYTRSAADGFEGGIAARDRMYMDGTACGPNDSEHHNLAVQRLEELLDSEDRSVANAALSTLSMWGLRHQQDNQGGDEEEEEEKEQRGEEQKKAGRDDGRGAKPEEEDSTLAAGSNSLEVNASQSEMRHDIVNTINSSNPRLAEELNREKERASLLRELRELEKRAAPNDAYGGASSSSSSSSSSSNMSVSSYGDRSNITQLQPLTPFGSGRGSPPRRLSVELSSENRSQQRNESNNSNNNNNHNHKNGIVELRSAADVANAAPPPSEPRGIYEADRERALALQCILASKDYDSYMVMLETMKVSGKKKQAPPPLPDDGITYGITSRGVVNETKRLQALCNTTYQPVSTGYRIPKPLSRSEPNSRRRRSNNNNNNDGNSSPLSSLRSDDDGNGDFEGDSRGRRGGSFQESFPLGNNPSTSSSSGQHGGALYGTAPRNTPGSAHNRSQNRSSLTSITPARAQ